MFKKSNKSKTKIYLFLSIISGCNSSFNMKISGDHIEQKQIILEKLEIETNKLKPLIQSLNKFDPENIEKIVKFKQKIVSAAIFHDIEKWFTKENIELVKDILNEPILSFNPNAYALDSKVNQTPIYFGFPIIRAINLNKINIAIKMIASGLININTKSLYTNQTPLHCAVSVKNIPLIRLLLIQGADIHGKALSKQLRSNRSETPLELAINLINDTNIKDEEVNTLKEIIKLIKAVELKQNAGKNPLLLD